jgi:hypothetical protein
VFLCLVPGRGGPQVCETSWLPHFLENRLTDDSKVVNLTRRPPFTPRKIPGTHFCQRLSWPQGHSVAGRIRSIEKSNDLFGNRTRYLPACSIMHQPDDVLVLYHRHKLLDHIQCRPWRGRVNTLARNQTTRRPAVWTCAPFEACGQSATANSYHFVSAL